MNDDSSVLRAWGLLLDTYAALIHRLEAEMQSEVGISISWFDVLATLVTAPDHQLRMGDLVEKMIQSLSFSRVSRLVTELASHNLVERITDPGDRRGVIVKLTAAGRDLHRKAGKTHMQGIQQHFGEHLNQRQLKTLITAFERILTEVGRPPSALRPWTETPHPTAADDG